MGLGMLNVGKSGGLADTGPEFNPQQRQGSREEMTELIELAKQNNQRYS